MSETRVAVVVSAVDRLSAPVRRMNAAMGRLTAPLGQIGSAIGRLGAAVGISRLTGSVGQLGASLSVVREQLGALSGLAFAGVAAGATAAAYAVMRASSDLEQLQFKLSGVIGGDAARGSMAFIRGFAATAPHDVADVTAAFAALQTKGIDPTAGALQRLGDAATARQLSLEQAAEAFAAGAAGDVAALQQLGIEGETKGDIVSMSFTDKQGRERTFRAAKSDARALQKAMLSIFDARGYGGAMDRFGQTWDGLWGRLSSQLAGFWDLAGAAGSFDFVKGKLAGLVALVDGWRADGSLGRWAQSLSDRFVAAITLIEIRMQSVDWPGLWARISGGIADLIDGVQRVVGWVGGWENAAIGLVAVLNGSLIAATINLGLALGGVVVSLLNVGVAMGAVAGSAVVNLIGAFLRLNWTLAVTAGRMAGLLFAPLIGAIGNFITALRAGYGVLAAFNLALAASPIGLLIAGVAALAGAAALIYIYWEPLSAWFGALWSGIKSAFEDGFLNGILHLLINFNPVVFLARAVNDMLAFFTGIDLYAIGAEWVGGFLDGFKDEWAELTRWVSGAMGGLTDWMPDWARDKLGLSSAVSSPAVPVPPPPAVITSPVNDNAFAGLRTAARGGMAAAATAASLALPVPVAAAPPLAPIISAVESGGVPAPAYNLPSLAGPVINVPAPAYSLPQFAAPAVQVPALSFGQPVGDPAIGQQDGGGRGAVPPAAALSPSVPPAVSAVATPGVDRQVTNSISAPVTVSITINGVAEIDEFRREAKAVVERALADWRRGLASDQSSSLYDGY